MTTTACTCFDSPVYCDACAAANRAARALASDADTARWRQEIDAERAAYMLAHDAEMARERDDESKGVVEYRGWTLVQVCLDLWVTECPLPCGVSHPANTAQRLREKLDREHPAQPDPDEARDREGDIR